MSNARGGRACSLIKIARILVQYRWQNGAADHDIDKPIRANDTNALAIGVPALPELGTVPSLFGGSNEENPGSGNRIAGDFKREPEFHFRCQGFSILLISYIKIRDNTEYALLLL